MMTLTLPDPLARDLEAIAAEAGRPALEIVLDAVTRYLEDAEDIALAREAIRRIESGEDVPLSLVELDEYLNHDVAD